MDEDRLFELQRNVQEQLCKRDKERERNITKRVKEFEKTFDFMSSHLLKGVATIGQSGSRQFRGFTQQSRGQRPQYNPHQFQNYRSQVHIRATAINTVATANPTSRVINQTCTEVEAVALNKQEDMVIVGPITTIITITSISITLMISRPNSMAHPVAYAEVLIIPLSIATKENTI